MIRLCIMIWISDLHYVSIYFIKPYLITLGATQGWRVDSLPGKETMLRRIQMPNMQTKVDEREQLGKHGTNVCKMSHQRLPTQAETAGQTWRAWRLRSGEGTSATFVWKMQGTWLLLSEGTKLSKENISATNLGLLTW